jgi:hypothetical protein
MLTNWLPPEVRAPTTANTPNVPASTSPAEVTVVPVAFSAGHRASTAGSCQAGCFSLKMTLVGLAELLGKCLVSNAWPAAESLCAGAFTSPPNPAPW